MKESRVKSWRHSRGQAMLPRVGDDAHDLICFTRSRVFVPDVLADRVGVGIKLLSESLIDDAYLHAVGRVGRVHLAAAEQRNPDSAEIVRPHEGPARRQLSRVCNRGAFDGQVIAGIEGSSITDPRKLASS